MRKLISLICMLSAAVFMVSCAADKDKGNDGDFARVRYAAELGDAEAQYWLGDFYALGRGVRRDFDEAVGWYRKAAEQGEPRAQFALGRAYETGGGRLEQDYTEATHWYRKAADQGHPEARARLERGSGDRGGSFGRSGGGGRGGGRSR